VSFGPLKVHIAIREPYGIGALVNCRGAIPLPGGVRGGKTLPLLGGVDMCRSTWTGWFFRPVWRICQTRRLMRLANYAVVVGAHEIRPVRRMCDWRRLWYCRYGAT
jgi:hypothetical protein